MGLPDLDQLDDPSLRRCVPRLCTVRSSTGPSDRQRLNVPERPTDRRYLSRRVGDEGASPAVARATVETQLGIPPGEQIYDRLKVGLGSSLSRDHEGRRASPEGDRRRPNRADRSSLFSGMNSTAVALLASLDGERFSLLSRFSGLIFKNISPERSGQDPSSAPS